MTVKELIEQRLSKITAIRAVYERENAEGYQWKAEDTQEVEKLESDLKLVEERLARAEKAEDFSKRQAEFEKRDGQSRIGRDDFDGRQSTQDDPDAPTHRDHADALQAFFRAGTGQAPTKQQRAACERIGFNPMHRQIDLSIGDHGFITELQNVHQTESPTYSKRSIDRLCRDRATAHAERRANMSTVDGTTGGYMVPMEFLNKFDKNMLAFSGMMQVAEIIRTAGGGEMPWITFDDTSNEGEFIGESATIDGSTSPTIGAQMWYAYKCHAKMIKVPQELIEDNAFNLVGRLGEILGERLARIKERKFTVGTGVKMPRGFTLDSTLGVTAASATAITFDELLDLQNSIDPAYRGNCRWMMHDGIALHLRKKKDGQGLYIWQAGTRAGEPDTIFGSGITYNTYTQATVATATKTVYYGDFSKYKVREVASLRVIRLDERYAEYDQVAFDALQRVDGKLLTTTTPSVKHILQA